MFKRRKPKSSPPAIPQECLRYDAPKVLTNGEAISACLETLSVGSAAANGSITNADAVTTNSTTPIESCAICFDVISQGTRIKDCGHVFHTECLKSSLQHGKKCPVCRKPIGGSPEGRCPSGTMQLFISNQYCPGFRNAKAIQIHYSIPSGTQTSYHDNSGHPFRGDSRTAYLPDTAEGRQLLHRLKFAFVHGLTFTVGTSLTTGRRDVVTWTSIHHKTSLDGGQHGFPDATYIFRCNESLDALGVPPCDDSSDPGRFRGEVVQRTAPATLSHHDTLEDHLEPFICPTVANIESAAVAPLPPPCAPANVITSTVPASLAPAMPALPVPMSPPVVNISPSAPPMDASVSAVSNQGIEVTAAADYGTDSPPSMPLSTTKLSLGDCAICFDALESRHCVRIIKCQHSFHSDCLTDSLHRSTAAVPECPLCRTPLGPQGKSPSGSMSIKVMPNLECPGFHGAATIQLDYQLAAGHQASYHEHPGVPYEAVYRQAYLPHTLEGMELLQRLKYCFLHGLSFAVGRSLATGKVSAITWTTHFPHKTSLQSGGPFGFPDDSYVEKCNRALDDLGVPTAAEC